MINNVTIIYLRRIEDKLYKGLQKIGDIINIDNTSYLIDTNKQILAYDYGKIQKRLCHNNV